MFLTLPRDRAGWALLAVVTVASGALAGFIAVAAAQRSAAPGPGRDVYQTHCADCHGSAGKGDGGASHLLFPRPRDFTAGRFKIRSTESGSIPTDDDLDRSVRKGLYGTSMPGWETLLPDDQIRAAVQYVKSFSPRFDTERPQPIAELAQIPSSPESIARGANVYARLQCGKCHGTDGRGTGAVTTSFEDDWQQPIQATDLTEPWTFHGGATARDVNMRFRAGMSGTPMPSFKDAASDDEMWDLANFVLSLARKPAWEMTGDELAEFYAREDAANRANPVKRGHYLVETMGCALCHSPMDEEKRLIPGLRMAGGLRIRCEPFGDYPSGNLTSDRETGLGNWSDDEIKRAITRGVLKDGTRLLPYPMDWASYSTLKTDDLNAIVAYLRTLPPIVNKVPGPTRTALPLYLMGKFRLLFLGGDPPMIFYAGNAGSAGAKVQ